MSKKTSKTLSPNEVVELATKLRNKLEQLGVARDKDEAIDEIPVHLADIYEICRAYQSLIDRLLVLRPSRREDTKTVFEGLEYNLYEHLPYHLKHLAKGLRRLLKQLEKPVRVARLKA